MFPAIKTARSPLKDPPDGVLRDHRRLWQATRQVLEENKQAMLAKPASEQVVNILKVWRIREVPEFYGLYFLYFAASLQDAEQNELIAKEIDDTLAGRSLWFSINRKKLQREAALVELQNLLQVLEGFDCMNNNRFDPEGEQRIKAILAGCQSLQEIKQAEEDKFREFSECLVKLRRLTYELISEIEAWRSSLATIRGTDMFDRLNKLRIAFIDKELNLLVTLLYDTGFVAQSFLRKWVNFAEKNDPFFIEPLKEKLESRIQTLVLEGLRIIEDSDTMLKIMYRLTQEVAIKDVVLPHPSNRSSRRNSKESLKSYTPRQKIVSPKQAKAAPKQQDPSPKNQLNVIASRNKIEIVYSQKKQNQPTQKPKEAKAPNARRTPSPQNKQRASLSLSDMERESTKQKEAQYRRLQIEKERLQQQLQRQKIKDNDYRRLSKEKIQLEQELEKERKKREEDVVQREKEYDKNRDNDYRRLSIEKEKLERELEKEKKKQQKEAENYERKFERLDRELDKFKEAERLLKLDRRERLASSQGRFALNNQSMARVYKKMGGSKGFQPRISSEERDILVTEKVKLEKALDSQRKRQSKEVIDYERKLQKYDQELAKVKEERNRQRERLKEIEREKEEKIRLKEQELLTIKKYIKEQLKAKPNDPSPYQNLEQYKSNKSRSNNAASNNQSQSDFEKENLKERLKLRRRIEDIYASNSNSNRQKSRQGSRYNSLNRSESASNHSSARVESIEIVYDKRSGKLMALAKKDGRQIKKIDKPPIPAALNNTIHEEQQEDPKKTQKAISMIYGSKSLQKIPTNTKKKIVNDTSKQTAKEAAKEAARLAKARAEEIEKQKQSLAKEYQQKMERERLQYKKEMESLEERLKIREKELIMGMQSELEEQKAIGQKREQQLKEEQRIRLDIEREKMLIQQERQRLALQVQTKRLKEELEKEIREELFQLGDIKKEEEEAEAERRLREEAIRDEIRLLEKMRNDEIVRMDQQNDQLRKDLLSRKRKLAKATTEESQMLQAAHTYSPDRAWKLKTQPADGQVLPSDNQAHAARPASALNRPNQYSLILSQEMSFTSQRRKTIRTESLLAELQNKADMQDIMTEELFARYKAAEKAPEVAEHDEIELLVKKYRQTGSELKPRTSSPSLEKRQPRKSDQFLAAAITNKSKKEIIEELLNNRREREKFQKELEAKGAHLRPTISRESANELYFKNFMDLRLQAELNTVGDFRERHQAALNLADQYCKDELQMDDAPVPQPRTIREHIIAHQKKLDQDFKKAHEKKNFFKINKERLKGPTIVEQAPKMPKPVKISEDVLKRQQEALKKYINRSKGKPDKKQRSVSKKKTSPEKDKDSKIVVVEKLDEVGKLSDKEISRIEPVPKNESHVSSKSKKDERKPIKIEQSVVNNKQPEQPKVVEKARQSTQQSGHTPRNLEIDLSRIPTENSQKQKTDPIQEYKEERDFHRLIEENERKLAEQRRQEQERRQELQRIAKQKEQQEIRRIAEQKERQRLKELELQRQEKIVKYRGLISEMLRLANYSVYQEVVDQSYLPKYLEEYQRMSSADLQKINKFSLKEALQFCEKEVSYHILVAKDAKSLEKGIGLFRKDGNTYLCDHLTTHQINTLSEVALSISRQIFLWDAGCQRIEFFLHFDEADIEHANIYQSFEQLCIDYGEVYQVRGDTLKRKYVVKRSLFLAEKKVGASIPEQNNMAFNFNTELLIGEKDTLLAKQPPRKEYEKTEIEEDDSPLQIGMQLLLIEKLKDVLSIAEFEKLKEKIKTNLRLKEVLLTTVVLEKKGLSVDEFIKEKYEKMQEVAKQHRDLLQTVEPITVPLHSCLLQESFPLPEKLKICRLTVETEPISYIGITVGTSTITATSSSYNTTSWFLPLAPKYKMLLMDATEYLAMAKNNPQLDLFFYVKHYIKDIANFSKQDFPAVYLPRVNINATFWHAEMREVLEKSLLTQDRVHFGDHRMASSIRMEPRYNDLVIKPPFLLCILSGKLERATPGTPLYARLITTDDIM